MTILALKSMYKDDKLKEMLANVKLMRDSQCSNSQSNSLAKIVKLLAPMKEEKISLYYNLIKTVRRKEKAANTTNNVIPVENTKKTSSKTSQCSSSKNDNFSTNCSQNSNTIMVDIPNTRGNTSTSNKCGKFSDEKCK